MSKDDDPRTLKDVAQAALDNNRGLSGRALDAEAKKRGLKIVYTTINHMAAGTYHSKPGRLTLEALSTLSGYSLEQVYAAANLPMPLKPLRDELPDDADSLTGSQRRVVLDAIRLFAQQNLQAFALEAELEKARSGHGDSSPEKSEDSNVVEWNFGAPPPQTKEEKKSARGGRSKKREQAKQQDDDAAPNQDPGDDEPS